LKNEQKNNVLFTFNFFLEKTLASNEKKNEKEKEDEGKKTHI